MDYFDTQLENSFNQFSESIRKKIRQKRIEEEKTVEDIAFDALGHNSSSFYSSAENLTNGKHLNLKHLFFLSKYFDCDIRDFFTEDQ